MKFLNAALLVGVMTMSSCAHEIPDTLDQKLSSVIGNKSRFILPAPDDYSRIPQSPSNPLTAAKVKLGNM